MPYRLKLACDIVDKKVAGKVEADERRAAAMAAFTAEAQARLAAARAVVGSFLDIDEPGGLTSADSERLLRLLLAADDGTGVKRV